MTIQHGEGEARFSRTSGGTASIEVGTRLPRPDRFDGCYNCRKKILRACPEHRETTDFKNDAVCKNWELGYIGR